MNSNKYTTSQAPDMHDLDAEQQSKQDQLDLLESLANSLLRKRDEAVTFRAASGIERRWREDEALFDGFDPDDTTGSSMLDYATGVASARSDGGPKRSKVIVNIVRGKCEVAEGRFAEIMFPTDDKNWGLDITPNPMVQEAMQDNRPAAIRGTNQLLQKDNGQPATISDIAKKDVSGLQKKNERYGDRY